MKSWTRVFVIATCLPWLVAAGQTRPRLVLGPDDAATIRNGLGKYPLLDRSYEEAKVMLDRALASPMDVPVPADAGGFTHERHKRNYTEMMLAGVLFQVSGDERYVGFVRDMLLLYSRLYPTLKKHPMAISEEGAGRLFWQTLNETVWMVHAAQAYDCVYDRLSAADRKTIEEQIFRPMARFFTDEHAREFDRIHNHGTWMVAAVGMTGYAVRDKNMVEMALRGTTKEGKGGFLRQIDLLFSPDGYYTEGPYYVRYALMPFFLFAQAIDNNQPELKIFEYRQQTLRKALLSAVQLTSPTGKFIPFNDALKEMSVEAKEFVVALDVTYARCGADSILLPLAVRQGRVMLSGSGVAVARAVAERKVLPELKLGSVEFRDGAKGDAGAVGVLRAGTGTTLLMKYAAQGMGHGHFDRLGSLFYDNGREILQDYGSARFINIEPKFGGRYLPENTTWSKQTIAHNTVTVDGSSQFQANLNSAELVPGQRHFFSCDDPDLQVMSAKASGTYPGVEMQRTMALVRDPRFSAPVVIDLFRVVSAKQHTYDLPWYYMGHLIWSSVKYKAYDRSRTTLGEQFGYQHLWLEAEGKGPAQWSWLNGNRYYTVTSSGDTNTKVLFARIGASDPNFNLRNEPAVILRRTADSYVFASVVEPHGTFDGVEELTTGVRPRVESVTVLGSNDEGTVIEIRGKDGLRWTFSVANGDPAGKHSVEANGVSHTWQGPYRLEKH
jgi:oligo-alginate lyase